MGQNRYALLCPIRIAQHGMTLPRSHQSPTSRADPVICLDLIMQRLGQNIGRTAIDQRPPRRLSRHEAEVVVVPAVFISGWVTVAPIADQTCGMTSTGLE